MPYHAIPFSRYWLSLTLFISIFCWQCSTPEISSPNTLLAVTFDGVPVLATSSDPLTHIWTLTVPYLTNLNRLTPTLTLIQGATVVPRSDQAQDFTRPVLYTVTAIDGAKTVYQLILQTQTQPVPQLIDLSTDTLEAGQTLILTGRHLGQFGPDVRVMATSPLNQTTVLTTTLLDSAHVRATLPFDLAPARYRLSLSVRNLASVEPSFLQVQYPAPQLIRLARQHLLGGDTLRISGLYIKPAAYRYALRLESGGLNQLMEALQPVLAQPQENGFTVRLDPTLPAGRYRVQVINRSENKLSRDTTFTLQLYDPALPFITGIVSPKSNYARGELVQLTTVNFAAVPARFYQLQLIGNRTTYTSNAIYDPSTRQLTLSLPSQGEKGTYNLRARLLGTTGQVLYSFDTDETFTLL